LIEQLSAIAVVFAPDRWGTLVDLGLAGALERELGQMIDLARTG